MIQVKNISKEYAIPGRSKRKDILNALESISLILEDNRNYAIVGESGSGKSTLARLLLRLESPTEGNILVDGIDVWRYSKKQIKEFRASHQMVLQDAGSSLDPKQRVFDNIAEPLQCLTPMTRGEIKSQVFQMMEAVELPEPLSSRYPHELSGGQQKRVCIARALSVSPRFILFDESTSGLDATVRKQILDLLLSIQRQRNVSYVLITHDIDVALYMAENVFVMQNGKVVEQVISAKSYQDFNHPYSKILIESISA